MVHVMRPRFLSLHLRQGVEQPSQRGLCASAVERGRLHGRRHELFGQSAGNLLAQGAGRFEAVHELLALASSLQTVQSTMHLPCNLSRCRGTSS
jgi:hypothetical protein